MVVFDKWLIRVISNGLLYVENLTEESRDKQTEVDTTVFAKNQSPLKISEKIHTK